MAPGMTTATTKRTPAASAGKIGQPVSKLTAFELSMVPMPVSPDVAEKYQLKSPRRAFETGAFAALDILEGDVLTTGGVDYHVRIAEKYTDPVIYTKLIVEQVMAS